MRPIKIMVAGKEWYIVELFNAGLTPHSSVVDHYRRVIWITPMKSRRRRVHTVARAVRFAWRESLEGQRPELVERMLAGRI